MIDPLFPPDVLDPLESRPLRSSPPAQPFRFVDLFAGIGGIRLGLERAGGSCVYTVELDRWAIETYNANFSEPSATGSPIHLPPRDIFDVRASDIPAYEILAAGFPCQPFSIAGVSKNLSLGREHGFGHEKSGNLFFQIVRLIESAEMRPPVLVLENVKHLVRHDGGNTFQVISTTLRALGYNLAVDVIDSRPWVPQRRQRTFIVCLHRDFYGTQYFQFPTRRPSPPWPTLRAVLDEGEVDARYLLSAHLWTYLQEYAQKHRRLGNGFGFGKFGPNDVARTLSARYYKDGSEILIETVSGRPRRLTPRECARLMGYPETFTIPVSDTQAYRQFGNSVVVPVIEFLAQALVEQGIIGRAIRRAA